MGAHRLSNPKPVSLARLLSETLPSEMLDVGRIKIVEAS